MDTAQAVSHWPSVPRSKHIFITPATQRIDGFTRKNQSKQKTNQKNKNKKNTKNKRTNKKHTQHRQKTWGKCSVFSFIFCCLLFSRSFLFCWSFFLSSCFFGDSVFFICFARTSFFCSPRDHKRIWLVHHCHLLSGMQIFCTCTMVKLQLHGLFSSKGARSSSVAANVPVAGNPKQWWDDHTMITMFSPYICYGFVWKIEKTTLSIQ